MPTDLYNEISQRLLEAEKRNIGGGGCCGTAACLEKKPFAEYASAAPVRTDLFYHRDYRLNELCKVVEALRGRIEELEADNARLRRGEDVLASGR